MMSQLRLKPFVLEIEGHNSCHVYQVARLEEGGYTVDNRTGLFNESLDHSLTKGDKICEAFIVKSRDKFLIYPK